MFWQGLCWFDGRRRDWALILSQRCQCKDEFSRKFVNRSTRIACLCQKKRKYPLYKRNEPIKCEKQKQRGRKALSTSWREAILKNHICNYQIFVCLRYTDIGHLTTREFSNAVICSFALRNALTSATDRASLNQINPLLLQTETLSGTQFMVLFVPFVKARKTRKWCCLSRSLDLFRIKTRIFVRSKPALSGNVIVCKNWIRRLATTEVAPQKVCSNICFKGQGWTSSVRTGTNTTQLRCQLADFDVTLEGSCDQATGNSLTRCTQHAQLCEDMSIKISVSAQFRVLMIVSNEVDDFRGNVQYELPISSSHDM